MLMLHDLDVLVVLMQTTVIVGDVDADWCWE